MFYNDKASNIQIKTVEENGIKCDFAVCLDYYDLTCFCDYLSDRLMEEAKKTLDEEIVSFFFNMRFSPEKIPLPSEYPILAKYDYTNAIFDWNSVRNNT